MENAFDYKLQNQEIQKALTESIKSIFPIKSGNRELRLVKIYTKDDLDDNDFPLQKEIKLNRKSWQIPVYANFEIVDTTTNKVIDYKDNYKIAYIPKVTNRFSVIIDGNEYQVTNQFRRKSGVYSRIK
ncbi:MAG: hypothetical protein N3A58_00055, partial [Spirochaetes bacterium]|nr:hypothetical protein [Spirochaetota bacterium]